LRLDVTGFDLLHPREHLRGKRDRLRELGGGGEGVGVALALHAGRERPRASAVGKAAGAHLERRLSLLGRRITKEIGVESFLSQILDRVDGARLVAEGAELY